MPSLKDTFILLVVVAIIAFGMQSVIYMTSLPLRVELEKCSDSGTSISYQIHLGFDVVSDCQIGGQTTWITSAFDQMCVKKDGQVTCYYLNSPDAVEVP